MKRIVWLLCPEEEGERGGIRSGESEERDLMKKRGRVNTEERKRGGRINWMGWREEKRRGKKNRQKGKRVIRGEIERKTMRGRESKKREGEK